MARNRQITQRWECSGAFFTSEWMRIFKLGFCSRDGIFGLCRLSLLHRGKLSVIAIHKRQPIYPYPRHTLCKGSRAAISSASRNMQLSCICESSLRMKSSWQGINFSCIVSLVSKGCVSLSNPLLSNFAWHQGPCFDENTGKKRGLSSRVSWSQSQWSKVASSRYVRRRGSWCCIQHSI